MLCAFDQPLTRDFANVVQDVKSLDGQPFAKLDSAMFIRNCWYVAAWSHEIAADALFARTITAQPVVFYRGEHGELYALLDRCCHRGAPLSRGRREGDCIRCPYHGLKYAASGACLEIPAQPQVPAQVRVRSFPVVERDNWVWIWMGDPARADPDLIPATPWLNDVAWRYVPGYLHYPVEYLLIADNLLDFSHLPFVHPTTLGGTTAYAGILPQVERLENGVRVTRWLLDQPPAPYVSQIRQWPGNVDRWNLYDFLIPGILLMDSGSAPTGTGAPAGRRVDACEFRGCQAITPETTHSTHYFFAQPHNFGFEVPGLTESIHQNIVAAFFEDQDLIKAQCASLGLAPDFRPLPLAMDVALGQFRHLVERVLAVEQRAT